jgi:hypothetical protein
LDILEHHWPERNGRSCSIRGIGCAGSTHLQKFEITLDVCSKGNFNEMVDPLRNQGFYARGEFRIVQEDLLGSCLFRRLLLSSRPDGADDTSVSPTNRPESEISRINDLLCPVRVNYS